jgi:ribosomal protein S12 methylthiotransferase accessory factor
MHTDLANVKNRSEQWVAFVGPCLPELQHGAHPWGLAAPPVRRGDLPSWLLRGHRKFAIIDGEFGQARSVSVVEIREALQLGAQVVGASSMGALRAAEAGTLGMQGVGWVYERYASGAIESDEEVALTFDPDANYRALTVPLVNLRWAVEHADTDLALTPADAIEFLGIAGAIDYRERSWRRLLRASAGASAPIQAFLAWAAQHPEAVDRKRMDAQELMHAVARQDQALTPSRLRPSAPSLQRGTAQPPASDFWGTPASTRKFGVSHRQFDIVSASLSAEALARQCGMSRVAEITGLDPLGVHCFSSIRPFAEDRDFTVTGGKGYGRESARLGAMAEACERACLSPRELPLVRATTAELSQQCRVLNPAALILDRRSCWSARDALHWWTARDLSTDQELWIPAAAVFYPFDQGDAWLFNCNTAGTALGASLSEALLYGLLEVVERDQLAYAELLRRGRRLDLSSVADEQCVRTLTALAERNILVHCWVVESEYALPLFYLILEDCERPDPAYLVGGLGCHLDPVAGFKAALLEAVYSRLTVISGAREDIERDLQPAQAMGYEAHRSRALAWQLSGPDVSLDSLPNLASPDIATDLQTVARACKQAGLGRILCSDLSPPGAQLKTVRVVVVGAEQAFHERTRLGHRALHWLQRVRRPVA